MQKSSYFHSVLLFILLIVLAACGASDPEPVDPKTGIFVDCSVAGIAYTTETLSGTTNAQGQFNYLPGETVTFSIGDINFPPVTADSIVTPLGMANSTDTANPTVVNIIRLLQTLDSSGDLSVIDIDTNAATAASGIMLDFTLSVVDFEAAAAVFLTAAVGDPNLVGEADAIAHFEDCLANLTLVGAWAFDTDLVVIFVDDSNYFLVQTKTQQFDPVVGAIVPVSAEFGTYTWDNVTGAFTPNALGESDGEAGFSDIGSGVALVRDGINLNFVSPHEENFVLTKVPSNSGILGAWATINNDDVIIFLDDSHYIVGHTNNTEIDSVLGTVVPVSSEFGTYTWDSVTGAFTTNVIGQSDGLGGFSDPLGDVSVVVDGTNMTYSDSVEGAFVLTRVE